MIQKLTSKNEKAVLDYLYQDPEINIFIIGDIENFGFNVDFQDVYAEFDKDQYKSVVFRYKDNVIYYCHENRFNTDWIEIINELKFQFISGKKSLTDIILPHFPTFVEKPMYFAEADSLDSKFLVDQETIIKASNEEDLGMVFDLLSKISEFDSLDNVTREQYIEDHMRYLDKSMVLLIKKSGKCISTAATVADTMKSAMVVAVATDPSFRNNGYASKIMIALMDEYINHKKKSLCLFFDNPNAGKIYHRLGFENMDMWVMLIRKSE